MNKKELKIGVLMLSIILMGVGVTAYAYQGDGSGVGSSGQKMIDSNDNGIPDGQEDFDGDGILNKDDADYEKDFLNMQDEDGDGIPNKDDEDYVPAGDGSGAQYKNTNKKQIGDGSRDNMPLRDGEARFENSEMYERVKGKILIKPEDEGRAYYVNPTNGMMRSLGRPADAFNVMREEGLGISNEDFDSWNGIAPENLAGKILLKVEDMGQAYYVNPDTLEMIYLDRPADAFEIMRNLGLGISNEDFESCFLEE